MHPQSHLPSEHESGEITLTRRNFGNELLIFKTAQMTGKDVETYINGQCK